MSIEQWWVPEPPGIAMTDARARALLGGRVDPKDTAEKVFVRANAHTSIPVAKIKVTPLGSSLPFHSPTETGDDVYRG